MKKFLSLTLSFLIVWALVSGGCYMLGLHNSDPGYYISIGLAGALGATFGPILAAWVGKKLKK
ncbi:MAG: hypothetical protein K2L05_09510 [Muribaculaceae bacterium]|nr:hypothetical protein [Muribaculaceae bacterium]